MPITSGSWEIAEGFVERSGYGRIATGNPEYPEMRGSFGADYSLDPDRPQAYDLKLWYMTVPSGTVNVDLYGRIESLNGDEMVYRVHRVNARLNFAGGGSTAISMPSLEEGTQFRFQR